MTQLTKLAAWKALSVRAAALRERSFDMKAAFEQDPGRFEMYV